MLHAIDYVGIGACMGALYATGRMVSNAIASPSSKHPVPPLRHPSKWDPFRVRQVGTVFRFLYLLQGPAIWLVFKDESFEFLSLPVALFITQLLLYYAWPVFFIYCKRYDWATWDAVALCVLDVCTMYAFFSVDAVAGALFVPYFVCICAYTGVSAKYWRLNGHNVIQESDSSNNTGHELHKMKEQKVDIAGSKTKLPSHSAKQHSPQQNMGDSGEIQGDLLSQ